MVPCDEVVAIYDDGGRPDGSAPRSVMRAQNLRHAATGVIVRDPYGPRLRPPAHRDQGPLPGPLGLHRRRRRAGRRGPARGRRVASWPRSSASPASSSRSARPTTPTTARRTTPSGSSRRGTARSRPQPEEVAYGAWLSIERLLELMADPDVPFMPDAVRPVRRLARGRGPTAARRTRGWDIDREVGGTLARPRPPVPDAEEQLRNEIRLMPRLAPLLPLEVPVPIVLDEKPLRVRHRLVPGRARRPRSTLDRGGRAPSRASSSGACTTCRSASTSSRASPTRTAARAELLATLERMLHRVLPLLPEELQEQAASCCAGSRCGRRPPSSTATSAADHVTVGRRPARRRHRLVATPGSATRRSIWPGRSTARPSRSPRPSRRRTASPTTSSAARSTGTGSGRGTRCCGGRGRAARRSSSPAGGVVARLEARQP